jgi:large subunit ribosomal protein L29
VKTKEIRKAKPEDLAKRLSELRLELAKELGSVKMGRAVKNPGKVRELRRSIARVLTVQKELQRGFQKSEIRK